MSDPMSLFKSIGLSEQKSKETLKNVQLSKTLTYAIEEALKHGNINNENGMLLYHLACHIEPTVVNKLPIIAQYIAQKKITTSTQVSAAIDYMISNSCETISVDDFEKACGVGVVVTPEEIKEAVAKAIESNKDEIIAKRYRFNTGNLLFQLRAILPWANGGKIKIEVEKQIEDLLGEKTEADLAKPQKGKKEKAKKEKPTGESEPKETVGAKTISELMKTKVHFHKPGENFKTGGYVITSMTKTLLEKHLRETGGKVITRFPPEPNGILHIGHAKAININFGYAAAYDGICYLRYDDTNPEKEEEKFFTAIREMVEWLGYKPYKITHSSDYFQQLYDWAIELIKMGKAYVCHQSSNAIKGFECPPSPWRDRPVEENLRLFQDMKNGVFQEGEATLRMKIILEEGKQDPVAYRIKYISHHRTQDQWCIYPTYDYTHCLCDSIENITHSLCTKEFQSRRSSYYWLCNSLNIYCPVQWEYGRLNINYTVVSKRKIGKLITEGIVSDWDDPRLFTLTALRRRGYPPEAINNFCAQMGVTGAQTSVDPTVLEAAVRDVLNVTAPRHMVVLEPLKVTIINFKHNAPVDIEVPDFPTESQDGKHTVSFDKVIYIEKSDFTEDPVKGFRRLTCTQSVGLKYAGVVLTVKTVDKDENGSIININVEQKELTNENKPKAFIHWVSKPISVEVRIYYNLFLHKNPEDPAQVPNGFLSDVNEKSREDYTAVADKSLETFVKPFNKFQFERIGFFSVDPDTKPGKIVFNRTVALKEDTAKLF